MILCGVDVETTGLDAEKNFITEIGWGIFDSRNWKKPLACGHLYVQAGEPVPADITEFTGITDALLARCGQPELAALYEFNQDLKDHKVDFLVAQNAPFDRGFINAAAKRHGYELACDEWIDTKVDIPYPKHIRARNLVGLCAEHGFLNPFPHSALFDVFSMMKLLAGYPIQTVLEYRAEPTIFLQALVDFANKEKAKKRGFFWENCENKSFPKTWVKAVKQRHVADEIAQADFTIRQL